MDFELLLSQGFDHIGVHLFSFLDDASLDKSRQVCANWKEFIEVHKFYWKRSIFRVHRQKLAKSKQWTRITESQTQRNQFDELKNLGKVLRNFEAFHKGSKSKHLWKPEVDPLSVAVIKGNIFQLLNLNNISISIYFTLHIESVN